MDSSPTPVLERGRCVAIETCAPSIAAPIRVTSLVRASALRLQCLIAMNECTIRTHGDSLQDEQREWDTISRLRIQARTSDLLQHESAVPIEIAPERTERYPVGLCEVLCELTARRPRD